MLLFYDEKKNKNPNLLSLHNKNNIHFLQLVQ